jgi:diphosphomevalonate decarboxylase
MDDEVINVKKVIARSPVNIALIKYWGKKDPIKVLPFTTSLSLTLTDLFTETIIEEGPFSFYLNGQKANEEETKRVKDVLKHFNDENVVIHSNNNFPTAAGLASSASGFAALTVGLNQYFNAGLTLQELAYLTRLGSGSSCRSLVDGFGVWDVTGKVSSITNPFEDLRMIVVVVTKTKKTISSRDAMQLTVDSSPLYQDWIDDSFADLEQIRQAINNRDFHALGRVMEINAYRLHELMASSQPPVIYQTDASKDILKFVRHFRTLGHTGYATMDAGSNVKILIKKEELPIWEKALKDQFAFELLISRIGGCAYAE